MKKMAKYASQTCKYSANICRVIKDLDQLTINPWDEPDATVTQVQIRQTKYLVARCESSSYCPTGKMNEDYFTKMLQARCSLLQFLQLYPKCEQSHTTVIV
jgi:hypothetical protein